MSLRTGKSGRYKYYACSHAATKGETGCKGRSIRMEELDDLVLTALEKHLLPPGRLKEILSKLAERLLDEQGRGEEREKALLREQREVEKGIGRLLDTIESGLVDDDDLFRKRLSERKQRRDELIRLRSHNRRRREVPRNLLSPRNLTAFSEAMRKRLRDPASGLGKAYVRLLVDRVVVGEREIEIRGSNSALMAATANVQAIGVGQVPTFVQE